MSQNQLNHHFNVAVSVPIKLLNEGEGHTVSIEIKTGDIYRGKLEEAEETMNCHLSQGTLLPMPSTSILNLSQ